MRAVESNWYRNFLSNLSLTKGRYDDAITKATSGKKLNKLSDNPADMAYVLGLRGKIEQINQFDKNIGTAKSFLTASESAMNSIQNSIYRVITLAEQGASETSSPEGRVIIAQEIDQIRDSIINYANTEVMGKYIFAGSDNDSIPFEKDPTEVPAPDNVIYNGDGRVVKVQADFSIRVGTNIPGNEVFGVGNLIAPAPAGSTDIFASLHDLRDALIANDTTAISNELDAMSDIQEQINESRGNIGNNLRHITDIRGMLKSYQNSLRVKVSDLEDADMAKAISDLSREEVGLQATLQAGSRIQRHSLMNYLG